MFDPQAQSAPAATEREPMFVASAPRAGEAAVRTTSTRLLGGGRQLVIEHAGQEYHLRLTRNDKLILTK